MKCREFKQWLEQEGPETVRMPKEISEHYSSCPHCRLFVEEERFWTRIFALAPVPSGSKAQWPKIRAKIQMQLDRQEVFGAMVVLMSRRLAPVFVILFVLLGVGTLWREPVARAPDSSPSMLGLVEGSQSRWRPFEEDRIFDPWLAGTQG